MNPYAVLFIASLAALIATSIYSYSYRKTMGEMHGMMVGMTLGMTAGLLTATLLVIPTGNFLWGVIVGSLAGLAFGIPFGRLGGHLGVMEGVMAGPMGGMMGAMLGQMIRPFNLNIFIPFFTAIILLSTIGLCYSTRCGCCKTKKSPNGFIYSWTIAAALLLALSLSLDFTLAQETPAAASSSQELRLPAYLQNINKETKGTPMIVNGRQEINVSISSNAYTPNTIEAKTGMPLRITFNANEDAGCGREVVIPDYSIKKIVPGGGNASVDLNPLKTGRYPFSCSMDMMRGTIIVS